MQEINVNQLKAMLDAGEKPVLIDVREQDEVDEKPFKYAPVKHIPMMDIAAHINALDPQQKTVIMCAKGGRSAKVATILMVQGFSDIINLAGGVDAWYEEGLNK